MYIFDVEFKLPTGSVYYVNWYGYGQGYGNIVTTRKNAVRYSAPGIQYRVKVTVK